VTLSKRRKIFYGLVILFLLLSSTVVLYAEGWRFDLITLKISKVGAIFVRSFPANANIFLDKKSIQNKSGLFGNGTLISSLFPKSYKLEMKLQGYRDWQEDVAVNPSLVTELKYALLVPASSTEVATSAISDFWLENGEIIIQKDSELSYLGGNRIGRGEILGATNDNSRLLILNSKTGVYLWYDTTNGAAKNINSALEANGLDTKRPFGVVVDPTDNKNLTISTSKRVYLLDTQVLDLTVLSRSTSTEFGPVVSASQFFYSWTEFNRQSNTSTLVLYDKFLKTERQKPLDLPAKNAELKWVDNNRLAALQNDGELYSYDVLGNNLEKIADDAMGFEFSSDNSILAVRENKSVEIFSFSGSRIYYRFNLPDVANIKDLTWYHDNNHLFIAYPDHVSFLDLTDSALKNFTTVAETSHAEYDERANALYFTANNNLYSLGFPR